ncbi:MAG: carboxymuconolactone decarboxylase family protein [Roseobacter sp.]|jgi:4-carboxymuconolactone decarboxylase|uniref:4-carboxymuconolactone decarboxylase n=2 Tax=Sulfitobacter TaxID=60136 RepID=A0A1H2Q6H1_9RHOB|nr:MULTISPECIES: carboxymuconolactone decarboxylase family protein [Sulfitobacter]MAJ78144.1 carboxymuconolactone decarboxylase family protein [Roseobacter sp.]MCP3879219.1 carboxymuconolactone decarboxylase family protein [Sulfitobacter sp.]NKX48043.1 carboxymuconolactone decarboxylase family protein [Rhodobacteraceae bacterium R_SAG8]AXI51458.1 carboxymuconolactone decarboxylase family protein [Sulfitobacter sp. SK025]EAP84628.1 4-carboxymuconolactone decarboxylase, putative [Sulfitobacter s|tara:strand:- start:6816 stop:7217 length:402 start_codon:yes stop_codon:yes gene_type:complete
MTDSQNPFEEMMRQMQDMAKAFPAMDAFSPKGFEAMMGKMPKDMMETFFGNTMNPNGLDAKTRMLLTISGLTMQGAQNDVALRQAVIHAVEAGAHKQQVIETIGQMAVFAGIPAMTRAMEIAQGVLDDKEGDA